VALCATAIKEAIKYILHFAKVDLPFMGAFRLVAIYDEEEFRIAVDCRVVKKRFIFRSLEIP
jgi:hypothetical protein